MVKILVADDSEYMRRKLKKMLKDAGYANVVQATNGREAIAAYKKEKPDLVLLDIIMEKMSGVEALKKIRAYDKKSKVIMVTVVDQKKVADECIRLGAKDYVTKPINEKKLAALIKKCLR